MTRRDWDVLVVGGGAFGTTLASVLADAGRDVRLWVRGEALANEINRRHSNARYLPCARLSSRLRAVADLDAAVTRAPRVLVVVPSRFVRETARRIGATLRGDQVLVHAVKGIEQGTHKRMSVVLREETCALKIGVLSGPNLAPELMAGHPAGAVIASRFDAVVEGVQALFAGTRLRVYGSGDVTGTEIAGAFKNILALAAGVSDGLGLGDNAKALLLSRGLEEMARYGVAAGGEAATFAGLAGLGDLMATAFSPLSRNRRVGERLAGGETLEAVLASMTQEVEGVPTTAAVHEQATAQGLDLPIVRAVHSVLFEGCSGREALERLMSRPVRRELTALRPGAAGQGGR